MGVALSGVGILGVVGRADLLNLQGCGWQARTGVSRVARGLMGEGNTRLSSYVGLFLPYRSAERPLAGGACYLFSLAAWLLMSLCVLAEYSEAVVRHCCSQIRPLSVE